jgi:hypothetical protein
MVGSENPESSTGGIRCERLFPYSAVEVRKGEPKSGVGQTGLIELLELGGLLGPNQQHRGREPGRRPAKAPDRDSVSAATSDPPSPEERLSLTGAKAFWIWVIHMLRKKADYPN